MSGPGTELRGIHARSQPTVRILLTRDACSPMGTSPICAHGATHACPTAWHRARTTSHAHEQSVSALESHNQARDTHRAHPAHPIPPTHTPREATQRLGERRRRHGGRAAGFARAPCTRISAQAPSVVSRKFARRPKAALTRVAPLPIHTVHQPGAVWSHTALPYGPRPRERLHA